MESTKNMFNNSMADLENFKSDCYGFDLFFANGDDLDKLSDELMIAWATHPEILGFIGQPDHIEKSVDEFGGILTYKWKEPVKLFPLQTLMLLRHFMTGHDEMPISYTGSELYLSSIDIRNLEKHELETN